MIYILYIATTVLNHVAVEAYIEHHSHSIQLVFAALGSLKLSYSNHSGCHKIFKTVPKSLQLMDLFTGNIHIQIVVRRSKYMFQ